MDTFA